MKQKEYTYSELHNLTLRNYQKGMMAFLFVGLLNFIGTIIGILKSGNGYFPSLLMDILIFNVLDASITNIYLRLLVNGAISIATSFIFVLIWGLTRSGKIKAIITGLSIYFVDTILIFIFYLDNSYLIPQLLLHVIVIIFMAYGIANYYHLFAIERKFKK